MWGKMVEKEVAALEVWVVEQVDWRKGELPSIKPNSNMQKTML